MALALGLLALAACDDDDGGASGQQGAQDAAPAADMGADAPDAEAPDAAPAATVPASGLYFVGVRLVEVGGIELAFQAELETTAAAGGGGTIDRFVFRALGAAGAVSDPLFQVTDLAVGADGSFSVPETPFVLPGPFSPSGSDVEVTMRLAGQVTGADGFCGIVSGEVVTIEVSLSASTFAAVPYGQQAPHPAAACGDEGPRELPRAAECPDLVAGRNTLRTGEQDREFYVFLPADHDPSGAWPLVILHNGLGQAAMDTLEDTEMASYVSDLGFVLIAPESYEGGGVEWDSLSGADSPDLALFDDELRCAQEKLGVDPRRIHVTGMSAGGLYTGFLAMYRAEVIASAAAGSGGLLAPVRQDAPVPPFLMMWGGVGDIAVDTDFNRKATEYIATLRGMGRSVIACNHGQGHTWKPDFTPWVLEFLLAHTLGEPLAFENPLPQSFPDYCEVVP
ncbi:MAG: hypothetical protein R3F43_25765 [bacterium]